MSCRPFENARGEREGGVDKIDQVADAPTAGSSADPISRGGKKEHRPPRVAEDADRFWDDNTVAWTDRIGDRVRNLKEPEGSVPLSIPARLVPGSRVPRRIFLARDERERGGGNRSGQHARATWCVLQQNSCRSTRRGGRGEVTEGIFSSFRIQLHRTFSYRSPGTSGQVAEVSDETPRSRKRLERAGTFSLHTGNDFPGNMWLS